MFEKKKKMDPEKTLIYYVLKEELIGGEGAVYGVFYQEDGLVKRFVGTQQYLLNLTSAIKNHPHMKEIYNFNFSRPESFPELRIERNFQSLENFYRYSELSEGEKSEFIREVSEEED